MKSPHNAYSGIIIACIICMTVLGVAALFADSAQQARSIAKSINAEAIPAVDRKVLIAEMKAIHNDTDKADLFRKKYGSNIIEGHVLQVLGPNEMLVRGAEESYVSDLIRQVIYVVGFSTANCADGDLVCPVGYVQGTTQYVNALGTKSTVRLFVTVK